MKALDVSPRGLALLRGRSGAKYKGWCRKLAAVPGLGPARPGPSPSPSPRPGACTSRPPAALEVRPPPPHGPLGGAGMAALPASGRQRRGPAEAPPRCLPGRRGGKGRHRSRPITPLSPGEREVAVPQERDGGGSGGTAPRGAALSGQSPGRHPPPGAPRLPLSLRRGLEGRGEGAGHQHGRHHRHGAGRQG